MEQSINVKNVKYSLMEIPMISTVLDHFSEFGVLQEIVAEGSDTILEALKHVESLDGSFPNTEITFRIMLTVPVTVASEKRSFRS
jgi:hypothetical protein